MTDYRFDGRSVVVTGAGRGIGRAHAIELAARGASVVVADYGGNVDGTETSNAPADGVVREIEAAGGRAVASYASVTDPGGATAIVADAIAAFGRLDALVNNAGISNPQPFEAETIDVFRRMIDVHYLGSINMVKAAWPHLLSAGAGRIVNTCSEAMLGIHPLVASYGGAKGGVFGLTRALAADVATTGIRVNAIAPRATTRMSGTDVLARVYDVDEGRLSGLMPDFPAAAVAPVVAFLAHQRCALNGEVLVAGGGQVQRLAIVTSKGIQAPALTPEDIESRLDALLDLEDAKPSVLLSSKTTVQQFVGA